MEKVQVKFGEWMFALYNFPLAALLYVLFILVFVWNAAGLFTGVVLTRGSALRFNRRQVRWLMGSVIVLFLVNWVYRLSMGLK